MKKKTSNTQASEPVLPGFVPLSHAWDGGMNPPFFRSEWSARYFVRVNRNELIRAQAMARLSSVTYMHPERFRKLMLEAAIRNVG